MSADDESAGGSPVEPGADAADGVATASDTATASPTQSVSEYLHFWWQRVTYGELGVLPIVFGLFVIVTVFWILDDTFVTARNFTNLLLQMAPIATIAIGIVFVLLIAEIDLSVAYVSAVGGVIMTLLLRPDDPGWPWWLSIAVALLFTTAIGFLVFWPLLPDFPRRLQFIR